MKQCSKCLEIKDLSDYVKHKNTSDRLHTVCKECNNARSREWRKNNKDRIREANKLYRLENREKVLEGKKVWAKSNPEKRRVSTSLYYNKNIELVKKRASEWNKLNPNKVKQMHSRWKKNNPDKVCLYGSIRRTKQKSISLSEEQLYSISLIYKEAKYLESLDGIKRHVDHIIPINGKTVCGLHVPWNLQILTASDNLKKGNKI